MKKLFFSKLSVIVLAVAILSSCGGLKKMQELSNTVTYEVTPKVLEMNNGQVEFTVTGKYPAKYFNKKAIVIVQPVLKYEGGELQLKPITLQGEAVEGNEKVISNVEGGSFSYSDKIEYKEAYMQSQVSVGVKAKVKDQTLDIGTYKLADGIIVTPLLVLIDPKPIMMGDKFIRIKASSKEAAINYVVNKYDIRPAELKKEEIKALNDFIAKASANPKLELKGVTISSYASPEGTLELNTKLADNRENTAVSFLKKEMKKSKISKADSAGFLSQLQTPEDWDGFKTLMEQSTIQDKELILRVLSMYSDPEVREREIKNISKAYEEIAEKILPQLRRSKLIVNINSVGLSDVEMIALADSNPDTFDIEEALYTANLIQDLDKKAALLKKAAEKNPTDVRPINNLAVIYIIQRKLDDAKASLETAKAIDNNDVVKTNTAAVAMLQNDLTTAEELLTASLGAGEAASFNLGIINIIKGKYEGAKGYFGTACEFNNALAKVLNKNYEDATTTLNCIKSEAAEIYYLKAVIGARMDNGDMIFANLRTAVGKDAKWKAYAKKDAEFLKYNTNDTFKSIVE